MNAFVTGQYTNVFAEYGHSDKEISDRIDAIWHTMFYGNEEERIYHELGSDMGYVVDTGNNDVRTEGMSYAMMVSVQLNQKEVFDRIWKWAKTYMWMETGINQGYFAWSVSTEGVKNSIGPAPDGEEYFAMALFFAANRWGSGEGIFDYKKEARAILYECVHKGEKPEDEGFPMWNPDNKLIKFIPNCEFSDPSYHLPHFYELFTLWADEADREFWKEATEASRQYLKKACHAVTGLAPEYAYYDGSPYVFDNRGRFYSDSYRVAANIGLDYEWFLAEPWQSECADKIQKFFCETVKGKQDYVYEIDGTQVDEKVLHPVGLMATNAQACLAAQGEYRKECAQLLWNTPLRTGERRYYDNFLYLFAFLTLSGNYKIYK